MSGQEPVRVDPPPFDPQKALRLGAVVSLQGSRFLRLESAIRASEAITGDLEVSTEVGVAFASAAPGTIGYAVQVDVQLTAPAQENHLVFDCTAVFELTYSIPADEEFDDESLLAFGMVTASMAAWPYLREAVQSLSARCGLQPIILDVLRQGVPVGAAAGSD